MTQPTRQTMAVPRFALDDRPVLTLPPGRTLGAVTGLQVGSDGHIWLLHMTANMQWGPPDGLADPASRLRPVCEFAADGSFIQDWGGADWLDPVDGRQQWPRQEETIALDDAGTVWVFGADTSYDHAVQRFTRDGTLMLRIGRFGTAGTDQTPDLLGCPTDAWLDVVRDEVYITDGYVNHRVAVFRAATGKFLRAWGGYGRPPGPVRKAPRDGFNNPVHAISRGPDGYLYVCDRKNDRVQVFDAVGREDARFVRELEINRPSPFGTAFNLAFTPDGRFMIVNDGSHSRLWIADLAEWRVIDDVLVPGSNEDDLIDTVHKIAIDPTGGLLLARPAAGVLRLRRVEAELGR